MLRELTIAVRRLTRRPTFTLPAIATLAVGIGATTAIFSMVHAVLLRPLPYPNADEIFTLRSVRVDGGWSSGRVAGADLGAIMSGAGSVMDVAGAVSATTFVIEGDDGRTRQVATRLVTERFFDLIGTPLAVGRAFATEPREGTFGSAVLSHAIWEQMYGSAADIVGRTLRFTAGPATIVGVAPPDFDVPAGTDVWLATTLSPTSETSMYEGYLRVRPGTHPDVLRDELESVAAGLVVDRPDRWAGRSLAVTSLIDALIGNLGAILLIVLAAAIVLLALGCVNVATLVLAREGAQTRELAIRKALGAGRGRVMGQLLTESLILSSVGAALGLLLAYASVRMLSALGARGLPRLDGVSFDVRVLAFAAAALITTTVLVGLLPVMRLGNQDVSGLVAAGSRFGMHGRRSRHLLSSIVITEIAMAVVLVSSAGWLVRSYASLSDTDPGFAAEGRLVFQSALLGSSYLPVQRIVHGSDGPAMIPDRTGGTPETWLRELTARLDEIDEIDAVGVGSASPFGPDPDAMVYVGLPDQSTDPTNERMSRLRSASPDFFSALGVRIVAGRSFSAGEPRSSVVVNEAFVREYLRGRDPLGASFAWGAPQVDFDNVQTIVGVVADVRYRSMSQPAEPTFYTLGYPSRGTVVVATSLSDPTPLIAAVRAAVETVDATIPVTIESLDVVVAAELARYRLGLLLMSSFAAISLMLAAIGIHGVVSHTAALRSEEFAIRLALGARPSNIARSVLGWGGRLWSVGVAGGLLVSYVAGRFAASRLYAVEAGDPAILGAAVGAVSLLTLTAYSISAIRSARAVPSEKLRAT
jgi:predicted permease